MAYNHQEIEKKWQQFWEKNKTFSVENNASPSLRGIEGEQTEEVNSPLTPLKEGGNSQKTFYALDMFPYPSGAGLHVGHPEGQTATDIISRKKRMEGYKVLHSMGWDAFGLPAENFAIKTGIHPQKSTYKNIENFKRQIQSLGMSYDWDREFSTTDPEYYKWTQDLFLKFYEKGLLYEDEKPMNWCPSCKVVVANEEVENGRHERCGTPVTKKSLKQWMFKITEYAERLLQDLEKPNVVLIHGWQSQGNDGWFSETREYLEKNGIEVIAPDFPNTHEPDYNEWKDTFEKEVKPKLQRNSILLGHSLGPSFIMKYLSEEDVKVGELVFFAPVLTPHPTSPKVLVDTFFDKEWDYEAVKKSADNIFIYGSKTDPYLPESDFITVSEKLDTEYKKFPTRGHFSQGEETNPEAMEYFEKVVSSILDWPEKIKAMQRNWIGKSAGCNVDWKVFNHENITLSTFTTTVDTIYGVTFAVISPENPILEELVTEEYRQEVSEYIKNSQSKSDMERTELNKDKTGVFTGAYLIHPFTGENIPLYIADYVLMSYGTGVVMGVPAHDQRDLDFANKYNIPVVQSVQLENGETFVYDDVDKYNVKGRLIDAGVFTGLSILEGRKKITEFLEKNNQGTEKVQYKLRDWIFTRQRYWGEPIPLVFDEDGKCYPLDESELPVLLPETPNYEPSETGESPLSKIDEWVNVQGYVTETGTVKLITENSPSIPLKEGERIQNFRRETSTMPNWAGSSWYWLRFMDARNDNQAWSEEAEKEWGPVDLYVGGAEHAVLHLLYARFWHKALYDMGLTSTKEPFKKLVNQGLILSYAYENKNGGLVPVDEVEEKIVDGEPKYFEIATGEEVKKIVAKMSKSLKNVVNPDDIVEAYGADTLRMYEMFMGPFEQSKAWDTGAVEGMYKFLSRIHRYFTENEIVEVCPNDELIKLTHQTVKKVSNDIDEFKFNTAISQLMVWMNSFSKLDHVPKIAGGKFVRLLAPFAPHLAEELWSAFDDQSKTITFKNWPSYDEKLLVENSVTYAVQVNGKLRGDFEIAKDASKEECIAAAKKIEKVAKFLGEGGIRKEIFVPGKIVGFVVK